MYQVNMKQYVIIDASEVANINFDQVLETSADTLTYSVDGTKTFVKFEGDTPSFLIGEPQYDHAEILSILEGPEWAGDSEV
jgi:hypothetical protein